MEKSKALQNKISAAINEQKKRKAEVDSYKEFLKGKQYANPKKDDVTFNICHSIAQAILDSILVGNSHIYVEPDDEEAVLTYELVEKIINKYWKKLKVEDQVELAVIDYVALGAGITYTDWDYRVVNGRIVDDNPFVLNIPYSDFLLDPQARIQEIENADYMIRHYLKSVKELKEDERYKHTKNLKGDVKLSSEIYKDGEGAEQVNLYQIWIPDDECSYVLREGSEDILREVENKFGREYPFSLLLNYKMPDELYPFGEIKVLYEPQKLLNRIYSLILTHARRVSTRQYAKNDLIRIEEARKLKDAEDGEIISLEGNAKPTDAISPIADAQLSSDVYQAYQIINSAIVQLSKVSEYRRSVMPQGQRKATEAVYVEQGTEMSTNRKAVEVKRFCEEIAKKIFILLSGEENIESKKITYRDNTGNWITQAYTNADLGGEYAFRWESGVEAPINSQLRQQKVLQTLQTISLAANINKEVISKINWTELIRQVLSDIDIKNIEKILTPEEPQIQEQIPEIPEMQQEMPGVQPGVQQEANISPEILDAVMRQIGGY